MVFSETNQKINKLIKDQYTNVGGYIEKNDNTVPTTGPFAFNEQFQADFLAAMFSMTSTT